MIEIRQIKLPVTHTQEELTCAIARRIQQKEIESYEILRRSLDSRKKTSLQYVYHVAVKVRDEKRVCRRFAKDANISQYKPVVYTPPACGTEQLSHAPVVVGAGPAGLFCTLMLARAGYHPVMIERGAAIDSRVQDVEAFWRTGVLRPDSNVQFGEGGAGTFSDGKLNTLVKDKHGRNQKVLETFVEYGAPKEILIDSKPHIGTDRLRSVIRNMRKDIERLGGQIHFHTKLIGYTTNPQGQITAVRVEQDGVIRTIPACVVVLAPGHSARDTFQMLYENQVHMEQKPFAIGLRIEHDRKQIQRAQYGEGAVAELLPSASYKLTYQAEDGRGVFTFCMCPGGFVVNASSEPEMLAVNGMSNHDRMERNSNSAVIVTIRPEDFMDSHPLAGIAFQRKWEHAAYQLGGGRIPVQRFEDLCNRRVTTQFGAVTPNLCGNYEMADLNNCLPDYVIHDIIMAIQDFDHRIAGFADADAVLSGVETRTSSPVKITRDAGFESNIKGLYPCGEGAGYAGGIMSAAMDGIKVYEAIAGRYMPN